MLTEKEAAVYKQLYDIADEKLQNVGEHVAITQEAFLAGLKSEPARINVAERLANLDDLSFLQAAYMMLLNRLPEDRLLKKCGSRRYRGEAYRGRILGNASASYERTLKQTGFCNNIYKLKTGLGTFSRGNLDHWYKRMPLGLQQRAKRIVKRFMRGR